MTRTEGSDGMDGNPRSDPAEGSGTMLTAAQAFEIAAEARRGGLQEALDACVARIYDRIEDVADEGGMETSVKYWWVLDALAKDKNCERWKTEFDGDVLAGAILGTLRDKGFLVRCRSGEALSRDADREVCVDSPHERLDISWHGERVQ